MTKLTVSDIKKGTHPELQKLGREIEARVKRLEQYGGKAVDMKDSIEHLLRDARKHCADDDAFAAFKKKFCPQLGKSRTYELLAIEQGKKTIEQIRSETRKRVADHRARQNNPVTENPSVTGNEDKAKQSASPPNDEPPHTEEDVAAQIVRGVKDEIAEWESEGLDLDAIREIILRELTFAFRGESPEESAEKRKALYGATEPPATEESGTPTTEAPKKKNRGRPLGSKNKPKAATPTETPAPPPERDARTAHLDPAETAEARKAAAPDDVPAPEPTPETAPEPVAESSAPEPAGQVVAELSAPSTEPPEQADDLSIPPILDRRNQPADQSEAA